MCEEEPILEERKKIKEKEYKAIFKMGRAQSNLEEKSRNPYKLTFGFLGEIVDKAEVIGNKHRM